MKLHELRPATGNKSTPKRVGRGTGSGLGGNAGKGERGQNARSGDGIRPGFEGGQTSSCRRLPERGLADPFTKHLVTTDVDELNISDNGTEVAPELLLERKVVGKLMDGARILGNGDIEKSLTIAGCELSKQATEKMITAGGKAEMR